MEKKIKKNHPNGEFKNAQELLKNPVIYGALERLKDK